MTPADILAASTERLEAHLAVLANARYNDPDLTPADRRAVSEEEEAIYAELERRHRVAQDRYL